MPRQDERREASDPPTPQDLRDRIISEMNRANRAQERLIADLIEAIKEQDDRIDETSEHLATKVQELKDALRGSVADGTQQQLLMNLFEKSLSALSESHKNTVNRLLDELHDDAKEKLETTIKLVGEEYKTKLKEEKDLIIRVLLGCLAFLVVAVVAFAGIKLALPSGVSVSPQDPTTHHKETDK